MKHTILSSGLFCSWLGACLALAFFHSLHPHPSYPEGLKFLDHCASYHNLTAWSIISSQRWFFKDISRSFWYQNWKLVRMKTRMRAW